MRGHHRRYPRPNKAGEASAFARPLAGSGPVSLRPLQRGSWSSARQRCCLSVLFDDQEDVIEEYPDYVLKIGSYYVLYLDTVSGEVPEIPSRE